jgi:hypothetical protein
MWPVVTVARMAASLRGIEKNTPLPTLEMIGGDTMEIKCPYCGSEEYEVYDTCGGSGENIQELCACFDCDKQFSVLYVVDCIVKES